jgi:hypothetical protein
MAQNDKTPKKRKPSRPDAVLEYTDSLGRKLLLTAEFKLFNDRLDISAITIKTTDLSSPITRRMLSEIPLDNLFRNDLAIDSEHLQRMLRNRKGTTAHQGRQHSEDDLLAIAEIYKAALEARLPVQKTIADAFGISLSTATKRIMAARNRGFITSTKGQSK